MAKGIAFILGQVFMIYGVIYTALYFAWNFFIAGIGFPQYAIPSYLIGLAGFYIFRVLKGLFKV